MDLEKIVQDKSMTIQTRPSEEIDMQEFFEWGKNDYVCIKKTLQGMVNKILSSNLILLLRLKNIFRLILTIQ